MTSAQKSFTGNRGFTILILAAVSLLALSCSRNAAVTPNPRASGNPQTFTRIISAAPSNTEIIVGLGMGDLLIAVDKYSTDIKDMPEGLTEIDFFYPDIEAIIGLAPDIILLNEINTYGVADNPFKQLNDLGIHVAERASSGSIEGIYSDIMFIAELLGVKERGEALVSSMKEEINGIVSQSAGNNKKVYFEISSSPTIVTFGSGVYLNELIEIAGGKNIFTEQKGWFSPSAEEIINRDPEVIFVVDYHGTEQISDMKQRTAFDNIAAVKENRIYIVEANSASRPTQNIMLALREIVRALQD